MWGYEGGYLSIWGYLIKISGAMGHNFYEIELRSNMRTQIFTLYYIFAPDSSFIRHDQRIYISRSHILLAHISYVLHSPPRTLIPQPHCRNAPITSHPLYHQPQIHPNPLPSILRKIPILRP